jgi:hypothetical protein
VTIPGRGGLPPRRVDQSYAPPSPGIPPGSAAGILRAFELILFGTGPRGVFVYNGSPAAGNPPVIALTAPGVTRDPYGNAVLPDGLSLVFGGQTIFLGSVGGIPELEFLSGQAIEGTPANIASHSELSGALQFLELLLSGPKLGAVGNNDWVQIQMNSANQGATSFANMSFNYIDIAAVVRNYAAMDATGFNIRAGSIAAADPSTSPVLTETWHSLGIFSTATWTVNEGRYRLTPDNPAQCELDISLNAQVGGGAAGAFTWTNNLLSEYQFPGNYTRSYAMGFNGTITTATNNADVLVDGAGTSNPGRVRVQLPALPATTNATCTVNIPIS